MKYSEFKDHVLMLLNQYSSNGVLMDNLYNNQSDYVLRIPSLYNAAIIDISQNGKAFIGTITSDDIVDEPAPQGMVKIDLPSDFVKVHNGALTSYNGITRRDNTFYSAGNEQAYVDAFAIRQGCIEYERFPQTIPTEPGADIDNLTLEGDAEQIYAAALYVAGQLAKHDDAFVYSTLQNEYDARCSVMRSHLSAEVLHIGDVYTCDGGVYL